MNTRKGNLELARFIGAILIMTRHIWYIGAYDTTYHFQDSWIWVEFYLIITGYFTAKHFDNKNFANPMKESIAYTIRKFIPLLPYTTIATVMMYLLTYTPQFLSGEMNLKGYLFCFTDAFVLDILLLKSIYAAPLVISLWYLSSLLIMYPIFAYFTQLKNRYWITLISAAIPLYFYCTYEEPLFATTPLCFLRVLAGMCIGTFIYEVRIIFSNYISNLNKSLLTVLELSFFLIPVIFNFFNAGQFRFIIICFTLCLAIMLPELSYTNKLSCKLFTYLGKLSIPVYILHILIGKVVLMLSESYKLTNSIKLLIYYSTTIITSAIIMYIVEHWKWFKKISSSPVVLND